MPTSAPDDTERINKYLAFHLGVSRRRADELIEKKAVMVNDTIASIGARVTDADNILVHDIPLGKRPAYTYLALHKPVGYVCSRKQQGDLPTIYSLIPEKYSHLKTVGRLDADSSGLLLMSDDGDFTLEMTHPRYYKQKRYEVSLDHNLAPLHQQMISDFGIQLEDGASKLTLERMSDTSRKDWHVIMSEGRNRQIRRTFASIGYGVKRLHRTQFGAYTLASLPQGDCMIVSKA
ncbi:MAG: pseudouridine synthase [Candidatus Saccharibacteria bacterium GW2011_GWC2_48_9]|nr:MAG: pseudouridine synthase [Candidatus Saccharibacteria bacterium GW2011_GWC2_48_9]HCH34474.1 ribosomal large subunit pseudouridine synthase B [Candidatus Saccharibacteria bacterium]